MGKYQHSGCESPTQFSDPYLPVVSLHQRIEQSQRGKITTRGLRGKMQDMEEKGGGGGYISDKHRGKEGKC